MKTTLTNQDKTDLTDLLRKLIAIPSVNTGQDVRGIPERRIADFIAGYLADLGMEVQWLTMPNGRPNVLGHWPDAAGKKILVLTAHMDTVNVDGMTVDPFAGEIRDGKIFGRGACDTKGSLAAFLAVLKFLAPRRERLDLDVRFLATCDEENGCVGSAWLADQRRVRADYMIVGEPTDSRIAVAHRGSIVLEFHTTGTSAHASVPGRGDNAIYQMTDLIECLRRRWIPKMEAQAHPLLGQANAAVTLIRGGTRFNVIPDRCGITVDLRILPDQSPQTVLDELEQILAPLRRTAKVNYTITCVGHQPALSTDPNLPFVQRLLHAGRNVTGQSQPVGVAYFADSSPFSTLGCSCVLLGPGDIAHAHSPDECLELDQLYRTAEILRNFFETS